MKKITAQGQSIKQLLSKKYSVDAYQREYKWEEKQINDLVDDLVLTFTGYYKEGDVQKNVKNYGQYFLGPIIVSTENDNKENGNNQRYIVDGQQRLTTLTLALICLLHMIKDESQKSQLISLICAAEFGEKSYNLNVPERESCLDELYEKNSSESDGASVSIRNIIAMHDRMKNKLEEDFADDQQKIPLFIDWLIEKVFLVEIEADSGKDAYKIFETMNDRGLRLTPVEMLKGYLLTEIQDDILRNRANEEWKEQIDFLSVNKGEDAHFIKSWLRARHAKSPSDYEEIGSQLHRWVRENNEDIGLNASDKFAKFIMKDFIFYAKRFGGLHQAAKNLDMKSGLECIRYLEQHNFTLLYPALLASLSLDDSPQEINCKLRVVATYLDILVQRRIGNGKIVAESTMRNRIFPLIPEIRDKNPLEIADFLFKLLEKEEPGPALEPEFSIHRQNGPRVHRILARITDYIERQSARVSHYEDYFVSGKEKFQIEHIWHNDYNEVSVEEEFDVEDFREDEFLTMRNNIGGLLLLPQKDNASYNDISYAEKRDYYYSQNLLAMSLHENCYEHNPGFSQFVERSGLTFEYHCKFQKEDMEKRQALYRAIADQIWNPNRLLEAAGK